MTKASLEGTIQEALEPGERRVAFADVLVRVVLQLFERSALVLTDRRLIVLSPAWPWGYKVDAAMDRAGCRLERYKERFDGSRLMIVRNDDRNLCAYFGRSWQKEADMIRDELRSSERDGSGRGYEAKVSLMEELRGIGGADQAPPPDGD